MSLKDFIKRQKMWARFHTWEQGLHDDASSLSPLGRVGELLELYKKAGSRVAPWTNESVNGILILRDKLHVIVRGVR